jgi:adenylate cyclase
MTQESFKRKLTAILSADVEGYSRLMGDDEDATIRTLTAYRELMSTLIQKHRGRVVDSPGDNLLAEFLSVVDAVRCAVEIQEEFRVRNAELTENRRMEFRIGINLGDVVEEGERIYGDGVNIAARLEGLSDPGGICISKTAFDQIESKLPYGYEYLGDQTVKNIPKPVGAYRVLLEPRVTVAGKPEKEKTATVRQVPFLVGGVAVIVLAVAVGVWYFFMRTPQPPIETADVEKMAFPLPEKPSIAVLPFDNMSDDPKQAYISDGITENIIMALSKTPKLFVIARNSTFAYKDKPINIKQAAEELGVRYILEGSVQKTENRVRITAQLIDATTGRHHWAERYDRELKDIFALQDEITLEIITALQVKLTEGEQSRILRRGTANLEAFLKILKGREHHYQFTKEDLEIAKRMYKEAIALDPTYATAYYWLAIATDTELLQGWSKSRKKDIERLFEMSEKIFSLDDSSTQAHIVLSRFYAFSGELDRAITEAKKAVDLDPNDAEAYAYGGHTLCLAQRYKEGNEWFKRAIRLNPSPPAWYWQWVGTSYMGMGSYEEAVATFKKRINIAPNAGDFMFCAMNLSYIGKHEEAIEMANKAMNLLEQQSQKRQNTQLSHLAEYYRRAGQFEEAIDTSRKLLDSNPKTEYKLRAYITVTCAYSALGKEEDAHTAASEILRIMPDFSVEAFATKYLWRGLTFNDWFLKHEPDKNLLMNALRKAGLK